jgi:hypothetical protein
MEIIVDKRIELMAAIQTLDNFWDNLWQKLFNKKLYQCEYKENVYNYFKRYKKHEAIILFNELAKNVSDVSVFIKLPLCHSDPPELNNIALIENNVNSLLNINFPYEKLINAMKKFYEDTEFEYFFDNNKNEYEKMLKDYEKIDNVKKYISIVDDYLGMETKNYTVIISALLTDCYGFKILTNENIKLNYSVMCIYDYKDNKYIFGAEYSVQELLWHEISHLTINDLTKNYLNQINVNKRIISKNHLSNYYDDVERIVNEYIIRAITIRLFEINQENKFAECLIQDYIQAGFKEIESIKKYILMNCEKDNKLLNGERYIELMEYIIEKIWE